ncbi:hypothetical protein [Nocardia otitidiscaviarum]|uniref:hypothetical protein n=1 Tax=Nocardia otitidiscaviarum TaxID=1823 RepID=UPI00130E31CF|nr:hypothetical protein [Nocardia otitidiscaviarum]
MTARRVDPAMQAWIDEQKKKFGPGSLDAAVQIMRAYDRADREKAQREQAGEAA